MAFENAKRILRNDETRVASSATGIYDDNLVLLFWENIEAKYIDECIRYLNHSDQRVIYTGSDGSTTFYDTSFNEDLYHLHAYYSESEEQLFRVMMKSAVTTSAYTQSGTKWRTLSGQTYESGTSNLALVQYNVDPNSIDSLRDESIDESITDEIYLLGGTQLTGTWFNIRRESELNTETGLYDLKWFVSRYNSKEYIFTHDIDSTRTSTRLFLHHLTSDGIENFENNYYFDHAVQGDYYYSTNGTTYTKKNNATASGSLPSTAKRIIDSVIGRTVNYTQRPDRITGEIDLDVTIIMDSSTVLNDSVKGVGTNSEIIKEDKASDQAIIRSSDIPSDGIVSVKNVPNDDGTFQTEKITTTFPNLSTTGGVTGGGRTESVSLSVNETTAASDFVSSSDPGQGVIKRVESIPQDNGLFRNIITTSTAVARQGSEASKTLQREVSTSIKRNATSSETVGSVSPGELVSVENIPNDDGTFDTIKTTETSINLNTADKVTGKNATTIEKTTIDTAIKGSDLSSDLTSSDAGVGKSTTIEIRPNQDGTYSRIKRTREDSAYSGKTKEATLSGGSNFNITEEDVTINSTELDFGSDSSDISFPVLGEIKTIVNEPLPNGLFKTTVTTEKTVDRESTSVIKSGGEAFSDYLINFENENITEISGVSLKSNISNKNVIVLPYKNGVDNPTTFTNHFLKSGGVYQYNGMFNGKDSWTNKDYAIRYINQPVIINFTIDSSTDVNQVHLYNTDPSAGTWFETDELEKGTSGLPTLFWIAGKWKYYNSGNTYSTSASTYTDRFSPPSSFLVTNESSPGDSKTITISSTSKDRYHLVPISDSEKYIGGYYDTTVFPYLAKGYFENADFTVATGTNRWYETSNNIKLIQSDEYASGHITEVNGYVLTPDNFAYELSLNEKNTNKFGSTLSSGLVEDVCELFFVNYDNIENSGRRQITINTQATEEAKFVSEGGSVPDAEPSEVVNIQNEQNPNGTFKTSITRDRLLKTNFSQNSRANNNSYVSNLSMMSLPRFEAETILNRLVSGPEGNIYLLSHDIEDSASTATYIQKNGATATDSRAQGMNFGDGSLLSEYNIYTNKNTDVEKKLKLLDTATITNIYDAYTSISKPVQGRQVDVKYIPTPKDPSLFDIHISIKTMEVNFSVHKYRSNYKTNIINFEINNATIEDLTRFKENYYIDRDGNYYTGQYYTTSTSTVFSYDSKNGVADTGTLAAGVYLASFNGNEKVDGISISNRQFWNEVEKHYTAMFSVICEEKNTEGSFSSDDYILVIGDSSYTSSSDDSDITYTKGTSVSTFVTNTSGGLTESNLPEATAIISGANGSTFTTDPRGMYEFIGYLNGKTAWFCKLENALNEGSGNLADFATNIFGDSSSTRSDLSTAVKGLLIYWNNIAIQWEIIVVMNRDTITDNDSLAGLLREESVFVHNSVLGSLGSSAKDNSDGKITFNLNITRIQETSHKGLAIPCPRVNTFSDDDEYDSPGPFHNMVTSVTESYDHKTSAGVDIFISDDQDATVTISGGFDTSPSYPTLTESDAGDDDDQRKLNISFSRPGTYDVTVAISPEGSGTYSVTRQNISAKDDNKTHRYKERSYGVLLFRNKNIDLMFPHTPPSTIGADFSEYGVDGNNSFKGWQSVSWKRGPDTNTNVIQGIDILVDYIDVTKLGLTQPLSKQPSNGRTIKSSPLCYNQNKNTHVIIHEDINLTKAELDEMKKFYAQNSFASGAASDIKATRTGSGLYNVTTTIINKKANAFKFKVGQKIYHIGRDYPLPPTTAPLDSNQEIYYYFIEAISPNSDLSADVTYNEQTDTWNWRIVETVPNEKWWNTGEAFDDQGIDRSKPAFTNYTPKQKVETWVYLDVPYLPKDVPGETYVDPDLDYVSHTGIVSSGPNAFQEYFTVKYDVEFNKLRNNYNWRKTKTSQMCVKPLTDLGFNYADPDVLGGFYYTGFSLRYDKENQLNRNWVFDDTGGNYVPNLAWSDSDALWFMFMQIGRSRPVKKYTMEKHFVCIPPQSEWECPNLTHLPDGTSINSTNVSKSENLIQRGSYDYVVIKEYEVKGAWATDFSDNIIPSDLTMRSCYWNAYYGNPNFPGGFGYLPGVSTAQVPGGAKPFLAASHNRVKDPYTRNVDSQGNLVSPNVEGALVTQYSNLGFEFDSSGNVVFGSVSSSVSIPATSEASSDASDFTTSHDSGLANSWD